MKAPITNAIRLAAESLLAGTTGSARGDFVREIIEIVRDAANGPVEPPDPLDDGLPGLASCRHKRSRRSEGKLALQLNSLVNLNVRAAS